MFVLKLTCAVAFFSPQLTSKSMASPETVMAIFNEHKRDTQKRSHSEVDENEDDEDGADSDSEATNDLANAADLAERYVLLLGVVIAF